MGEENKKSCKDCEYFGTECSSFYDDDFVEFICSKINRTIMRTYSKTIREVQIPKWCPKLNGKTKEVKEDDGEEL